MKTTTHLFFVAIILLAAIATVKHRAGIKKADQAVMVSQNPIPACPPFCDPDPNSGPDTKTAKR